jgi:NAD(P)-dependent dehydrogenase (short-subunit alcohol dehydrogenase family)
MHHGVAPDFADLLWRKRRWQGAGAYAESKFYDTVLAFAVARHWPAVRANALEPGWVPTRMGGPGAPGDMAKAHLTQAWLAVSEDALARSSGEYFYHQALRAPNPLARDEATQETLLRECARLSGVPFKP